MRLNYKTGTATFIQFIVLGFLNIANAVDSIITTCNHPGGDCVGNLLTSVVYFLLITTWFGVILALGFGAQERRNKRIAALLICAELAVFAVAGYNIKLNLEFHNGVLGLVTSCADIAISVWVISLAYRIIKAGGGRVVRRRPVKKS